MSDWNWDKLQAADRKYIWHPYSSATDGPDMLPVVGATVPTVPERTPTLHWLALSG